MCRRPSNKVFPSVYIEGVTQLAFDVQWIRKDAWPAIFIDATVGDQSITQRAFGESTFTCKGIGILAVNS